MKQNFGFIVAVCLLASVLVGAVLFHSRIERALWPSRPADLSNKIVQRLATSEPAASADSANTDRLDSGEPLPAPHSATARVDEIKDPIEPMTSPAENFGQPTGLAAAAGKEFAFDLYARLAASPEGSGKNLFFSPYSVSSVLIMAAEGARGETAEQMGKALHFPQTLRREGPDAADNPWDLGALHRDMAATNQSLNGMPEPERRKLRYRLSALRRELAAEQSPPPPSPPPGTDNTDRLDFNTGLFGGSEKEARLVAQIDDLIAQVDPYELNIANALWVEKTYPLQKPYVDVINRFYQTGGAFPVDFANNSDAASHQINAWVKQQTKRRIAELISPDAVGRDTALVLTDAVYFKGAWVKPFPEDATRDADFATVGEKVRVPMMHEDLMNWARYGAFNADGSLFQTPLVIPESKAARADDRHDTALYPGKGGFTILKMPYKGARLSMVVLLPQDEDGLGEIEKIMTAARFEGWIAKLDHRDVHVFFPKFKLNTSYDMIPALKTLGMNRAFVRPQKPDGAQFDGICASEDPDLRLFVSKVLHQAFVDVNEKGTEAAAATVLGIDVAAAADEPFIPTFRADRPFIFTIRDADTGTILFLGRVVDPRG